MKKVPCNFCLSDETSLLFATKDLSVRVNSSEEFLVRQCRKCGLVFLSPQPSYEELASYYSGDYYTHIKNSLQTPTSGFYKALRWFKKKLLDEKKFRLPTNLKRGRFIDVGCGKGNYIVEYKKQYPEWEFYGTEPDQAVAQIAKEIPSIEIFNGFLQDARYQDDFFDIVIMNHSFEHMPNPSETMREIFRILKHGGKVIVRVPNFGSTAARIFRQYWAHLDVPRHIFHFTEKTLGAIMVAAGFKILYSKKRAISGSVQQSISNFLNIKTVVRRETTFHILGNYLRRPIGAIVTALRLGGELEFIATKE